MSRIARFRVVAQVDGARPVPCTVTIDRDAQIASVRPLRRRREYTLPLSRVASFIVQSIVRAEVAEKRRAKGGKRRLVPRRKP